MTASRILYVVLWTEKPGRSDLRGVVTMDSQPDGPPAVGPSPYPQQQWQPPYPQPPYPQQAYPQQAGAQLRPAPQPRGPQWGPQPSASQRQFAARWPAPTGPGTPPETMIPDLQAKWLRGEYQSTRCLIVQPDGTVKLRPRVFVSMRSTSGRLMPIFTAGAAAQNAAVIHNDGRGSAAWDLVLAIVFCLAVFGVGALIARNGVAILTPTSLIFPTWYGRRRTVPRYMVARAVMLRVSSDFYSIPWTLLYSIDGYLVRSIRTYKIPKEDMLAFVAALGASLQTRPYPITPQEAQSEYPGALPLLSRSPFLRALLILIPLAVIVPVLVMLHVS
jgi:hypothetical protein